MADLPWPGYGSTAVCPHCGADYDQRSRTRHLLHKRTGRPRCSYARPDNTKHGELVLRAARWLKNSQRCHVVFAEPTVMAAGVIGPYMPDAIGWRAAFSLLVECKVTLADLRAEKKKRSPAPGNLRWFLVPPGIAARAEAIVRDEFVGWGLCSARGRAVRCHVEPTMVELCEAASTIEREILVTSLRRHQQGVRWLGKSYRFETLAARDRRIRASVAQEEPRDRAPEEDARSAPRAAPEATSD